LWVGVNKQHALLKYSKCTGKVDSSGGLSDPTFLVCYGNDFSHGGEGSTA
jgi:hypothetical protein